MSSWTARIAAVGAATVLAAGTASGGEALTRRKVGERALARAFVS
jgi:hypothetical protein